MFNERSQNPFAHEAKTKEIVIVRADRDDSLFGPVLTTIGYTIVGLQLIVAKFFRKFQRDNADCVPTYVEDAPTKKIQT